MIASSRTEIASGRAPKRKPKESKDMLSIIAGAHCNLRGVNA